MRRFSWARFLPFAVMAALWGVMMHENAVFALVLAWVVAPNGQEWYQDRFGTQGRMGRRWTVWSTGGRMVTLALIFLIMSKDITGWGNSSPDIQFGLGFHPDSFTLEAADFLDRHNEIKGNILNTSTHQGDLLIWKSAPKRKTYVDGRSRLFPQELLEEWHKTRKALSEDDVAGWKPLLDKYEISAVMIEPADAPITYRAADAEPELGAVLRRRPDRDVRPGGCAGSGPGVFQGEQARRRSSGVSHDASGRRGGAAAQSDVVDRRRVSESNVQPAAVADRIGAALAERAHARGGDGEDQQAV